MGSLRDIRVKARRDANKHLEKSAEDCEKVLSGISRTGEWTWSYLDSLKFRGVDLSSKPIVK